MSYWGLANSLAWPTAFYALALFLNYPHYMATIYRAYRDESEFQKYRVFTLHLTGLVALTVVVSHFWYGLLPWIFTLYLTWSPWHYTGQNYGLFMMFARRTGGSVSHFTRRVLYSSFAASYVVWFLNLHSGPSDQRLFVSLGIPVVPSEWARIVFGVVAVGLAAAGVFRMKREVGSEGLTPGLVLFSTQALWFLVPGILSLLPGFRMHQSHYSIGVLAVAHSAQYLWITSYYARREAMAEGRKQWHPMLYFAVLVAGGIALFIPGPWIASYVFHYDFTTSFLIFSALVNIHHFILDGAIWKLRDGRIAALLLTSQEKLASAASGVGSQVGGWWQWMRSEAAGARAFRIGLALLMFGLAAVDQTRFVRAAHSDDAASLGQAAELNPYDTSLQMRLARKAADQGDGDSAVAAWKAAMAANPSDPNPRNALLDYLARHDRTKEAYELGQQSLASSPRDAGLLVDVGILAAQIGLREEAATDWQRALVLDPSQTRAHLYLADHLDRQGHPEAAAPHYMIYLEKLAQVQPSPEMVLPVLVKLAQCQVRSGRSDQAVKSYDLAQTLSARAGAKKIEGVAALGGAELKARNGDVKGALRGYQRALTLDEQSDDQEIAAGDWFSYAQFLRNEKFPVRYAYASVLKAEALAGEQSDLAKSVATTRRVLERELGSDAARLRRDVATLTEEALELHRQ